MINFPFFLLLMQEKIQTLQLLFFNPMCLLVCDAQLVLVRQAVSALQQTHESEIELDACWSFGESVPETGVSGTRRRCSRAPFTCNTRNANLLTEFPTLFIHMNSSLTLLFTLTAQRQAHLDIKSTVSRSEEQTSRHSPATHAIFSRSYMCPPQRAMERIMNTNKMLLTVIHEEQVFYSFFFFFFLFFVTS